MILRVCRSETEEQPNRARAASLKTRVVSAGLLVPFALISIVIGGWWLAAVAWGGAALMSWEWVRQVAPDRQIRVLGVYMTAIGAGVVACMSGASDWALFSLLAGAVFCGGFGLASGRLKFPGYAAFGVFYIGFPAIVLVDLSRTLADGTAVLFWLFILVWATDTGAYLIGKPFGRTPLLPRISPNKTWEGLVGGIGSACLVGAVASFFVDIGGAATMAVASGALAVIAQAGDFTESAFKRRFGVKDMSRAVPGHGGLLDRLDGLLFVLGAAGIVKATWII